MKKKCALWLAVFLTAGTVMAAQSGTAKKSSSAATKTFEGSIGDSMCGLKHMMGGGDKECTLECVKGGGKFVLVDAAHKKVYQLSDQKQPIEFAGQKVKVTGTLKGEEIEVKSIAPAL